MSTALVDFKAGQQANVFTPDLSIKISYITDCTQQSMSFGKIKAIVDYLSEDIKLLKSSYEAIGSKGTVFVSRESTYEFQDALDYIYDIMEILRDLEEINLKEMINEYNTNLEMGKSKWCARRTNQIVDEINERNDGKGVVTDWEWNDSDHDSWHYVYTKVLGRSVAIPGTLKKWYDQDVIRELEKPPFNVEGFDSWLNGSMKRPSDTGE